MFEHSFSRITAPVRLPRKRVPAARLAGLVLGLLLLTQAPGVRAQVLGETFVHTRGRIWDEISNVGMIGSYGAWDFQTASPLGMFPGFEGYSYPVGNEFLAVDIFSNANYHNFRAGPWILVKGMTVPGVPPDYAPVAAPYELFLAGSSGGIYGAASVNPPIEVVTNFAESENFDPLLPEEWTEATWPTNTGITVTRRSHVWSYPGYSDFIIYDYVFKNTGDIVSVQSGAVVPADKLAPFQQTLNEVYFTFHGGVAVSTKSVLNFHDALTPVQAGAFGWQPPYHDFFHVEDDGAFMYSTNYNGGREPLPNSPWDTKETSEWKQAFPCRPMPPDDPSCSELMDPAAFGWLALYASPTGGTERSSAAPDIYRIDSHKGAGIDLEFFNLGRESKQSMFNFATTEQIPTSNPGNRFNFYTHTYGPYTLAPGDSVRIVMAEIAGVMDYTVAMAGDPDGHFPDSTIAAIRRNAELARNAVEWGLGGTAADGRLIAADAPEPPPPPAADAVNASRGTESAAIGVTWDKIAEETIIPDGSGSTFYNGLESLDGYRIYRSQDFQFDPSGGEPVFRGAGWTLFKDIPKSEFAEYWNEEIERYQFADTTVSFGFQYGYYVSAYNDNPGEWVSANGTRVTGLPTLESGSPRKAGPASALAGPVESFDIYATPNPHIWNDPTHSFGQNSRRIEFRNLPERATIRIYSISGDLVAVVEHGPDERGSVAGTKEWEQKSDSGLLVAPGLYIYHVQSTTEGLNGQFTGKLMIVR